MENNKKYRLMIAHANAKAKGEKLLDLILSSQHSITDHFIVELGCALADHAGPGALVVGLQEVD